MIIIIITIGSDNKKKIITLKASMYIYKFKFQDIKKMNDNFKIGYL